MPAPTSASEGVPDRDAGRGGERDRRGRVRQERPDGHRGPEAQPEAASAASAIPVGGQTSEILSPTDA
jgi:hypothetical protein